MSPRLTRAAWALTLCCLLALVVEAHRFSQVGRYQQRADNPAQCFDTATGEVCFVRYVVQLKSGKTVRLSANPANPQDSNP